MPILRSYCRRWLILCSNTSVDSLVSVNGAKAGEAVDEEADQADLAADDDFKLPCALEAEEEDHAGLVSYTTTSSVSSVCVSHCPLPDKKACVPYL